MSADIHTVRVHILDKDYQVACPPDQREALVEHRLKEVFLESGTDYVLLLRFDGTREAVAGSVVIERPVATVVDSFEPSSGLFARLGR